MERGRKKRVISIMNRRLLKAFHMVTHIEYNPETAKKGFRSNKVK